MNEFDIRGEVNVRTVPISLVEEPTGVSIRAVPVRDLLIGGRSVPEDACY